MATITSGPVRLAAVVLLIAGVLLVASAHRSGRLHALLAGFGALLATVGGLTMWVAWFVHPSDGSRAWQSVSDVYFALFDSWIYVCAVALVGAVLWVVVAWSASHAWSRSSTAGIVLGSVVGSVLLGLLDTSISPL